AGSASRGLKRHRLSVVFGSFAGAVGLRHDSGHSIACPQRSLDWGVPSFCAAPTPMAGRLSSRAYSRANTGSCLGVLDRSTPSLLALLSVASALTGGMRSAQANAAR